MNYHLLASGSKGNAFILENGVSKLLIDCGMTQRYLKTSLSELNIELSDLDAVLITHDHIDHVSAINLFKNHQIYSPGSLKVNHEIIKPYEKFNHGSFEIMAIPTSHDTDISVGYVIEDPKHKLVYITDTGYIKNEDLKYLKDAEIIVMESNHDPELLMKTNRPYHIKQRILSDKGHLSNESAGTILSQIVSDKTQEIILAHLSEEANTEDLAYETVRTYLGAYDGEIKVGRQTEIVSGKVR